MTAYYIYKYKPYDFRDPEFKGTFETDQNMLDIYDLLTGIFGEGFFYRRKKI